MLQKSSSFIEKINSLFSVHYDRNVHVKGFGVICRHWWSKTVSVNNHPHPKDGEANVFSLFTPWGGGVPSQVQTEGTPARSRQGYPSQVQLGVPWSGMGYPLARSGWGGTPVKDGIPPLSRNQVTPPPSIGQKMEYLICGMQYASCVYTGLAFCKGQLLLSRKIEQFRWLFTLLFALRFRYWRSTLLRFSPYHW